MFYMIIFFKSLNQTYINIGSRSPVFSFLHHKLYISKRPLHAGKTVLSTGLCGQAQIYELLSSAKATDFSLSNVLTVRGTDAKLHGNILVISSDCWEWSKLEVKHNFVFIEGNYQHDGKSKQQS